MKRVKRMAVLVMAAAMMLSGCGKTEKVEDQSPGMQKDYGSAEQEIVQNGPDIQKDSQEAAITSYEELEVYQGGRMGKIREAYESCGIEYEITPNECFLLGVEESYEILEREYEIFQMAYSIYNYEQNLLNTVIDFEYEFHPEKEVTSDDKYIQLLSALIHTTENEELKEKFPTSDSLVSEITACIGSGADCIVFEAENCRLKMEVDGSAKYILGFVNIEDVICNIPRVEPTYKEFASLDDYTAYIEANLWEDTGIDMDIAVNGETTAYGVDNNFAMRYRLEWYPYDPKEPSASEAREAMMELLEYLDIPDLDIEKTVDEWMSHCMVSRGRSLDYIFSSEWFGVTPLVDQYPFMHYSDVVIPIKVEGMLNR